MWKRLGLPVGLAVALVVAFVAVHAAEGDIGGKTTARAPAPTPSSPTVPLSAPPTEVRRSPGKIVYLTFDDGPDPRWTPQVLAVLARYHAHATFFELAEHANPRPDLVAMVRAAGDTIGNHSITHPVLTRVSAARLHQEVAGGVRSKCFRPPYGATNVHVRAEIRRDGMRQVLWDVDPRDWSRPGASAIAHRVLAAVHPGAVVIMHDGGGNRSQTVQALGPILATLAARGYNFASLAC